jgi:hypothetical protein
MKGEGQEAWTSLTVTLTPLRTSKQLYQAMRQVTPTLWLLQTCCEQDEKGGSVTIHYHTDS